MHGGFKPPVYAARESSPEQVETAKAVDVEVAVIRQRTEAQHEDFAKK